ncbi:PREDICTED: fatty-acid-binding protein 1-like [Nelumbo nucifera]|uniref:Fatty-acid-binding protein 1-like n=2 Tax=Nelumbo nucifera TaxID=4432 RepID=A0A822YQN8_NELNU|nr:PREDICTED: fatty-acid-binding protein 1-like [Nelumbo nucifera]DAD34443.1 TPA_asm: hypothetical protein HUJ06_005083 [Nelumbo nucifera]
MAATVDEVTAKAQTLEIEPKTGPTVVQAEAVGTESKNDTKLKGRNAQKEEVEPKTGVSFPVQLDDGKQLSTVGVRKKSILGITIKVYGFGLYTDNEAMKHLMKSKIGKAPAGKATKEMYQLAIDSDVEIMVRLVIVFPGLTMNIVRKSFDENLGASIKKITGQKNEELLKKIMGQATDNIKLPAGSVIEITRLPGYTLQTKVRDEVVSKVDSELLCRAYINMYLGDDVLDNEAKERFGKFMLSLF